MSYVYTMDALLALVLHILEAAEKPLLVAGCKVQHDHQSTKCLWTTMFHCGWDFK